MMPVQEARCCSMQIAPQDRDQHAANICSASAEIDKRQNGRGVVNYVHNFELLTASASATDDAAPRRGGSPRGHRQAFIHLMRRMGIVISYLLTLFCPCRDLFLIRQMDRRISTIFDDARLTNLGWLIGSLKVDETPTAALRFRREMLRENKIYKILSSSYLT